MAVLSTTFREDRGPFIFDRMSRSSVQKPQVYCRDFKGCGFPEYVAFSMAGAYLVRDTHCHPPESAFVFSISGYALGGLPAANLRAFAGDLIDFAADNASTAIPDSYGLSQRGAFFIESQTGSQMILPQYYALPDPCGDEHIIKYVAAGSINGYDDTTCLPYLSHQVSVSLQVNTRYKPQGWDGTLVGYFTYLVEPLFDTIANQVAASVRSPQTGIGLLPCGQLPKLDYLSGLRGLGPVYNTYTFVEGGAQPTTRAGASGPALNTQTSVSVTATNPDTGATITTPTTPGADPGTAPLDIFGL